MELISLLAIMVGAMGGALMAVLGDKAQVLILAIPLGSALLIRFAVPSRAVMLTPARFYLPILTAYTLISLLVTRPVTAATQAKSLIVFVAVFAFADWGIRLVLSGGRQRAGSGQRTVLTVAPWAFFGLELLGVLLLCGTFAQHGVPLLSNDVAAVRVELASTASVFIVGMASLQICLVVSLLNLASRVSFRGGALRPTLHVIVITALLLGTAGRSAVLIPYALAGLYLLLDTRRPLVPMAVALVVAVGFFTAAGIFRSAGAQQGPLGPATGYLTATSKVSDRIIRGQESGRWEGFSPAFLWIPRRLIGGSSQPPGIELREAFGLEFEGFGAEMGIIGALWFDMGFIGVPVGALAFGALAGGVYAQWRRKGQWWNLGYSYMLVWLLLTVTQHPLASYWYLIFPILLSLFAFVNRSSKFSLRERTDTRMSGEAQRAPPVGM